MIRAATRPEPLAACGLETSIKSFFGNHGRDLRHVSQQQGPIRLHSAGDARCVHVRRLLGSFVLTQEGMLIFDTNE